MILAATSGVMARTDSRTVAKSWVRRAMNSLSSRPRARMWFSIALNSATSVPGSIWRWMSARPASSVRRGSATTSLTPRSCARLIAAPKTGCDSVVFAPAMKMTSAACSTSRIEPDAADVFSARCIAATDVEWQSRVQWSMLFVPSAARNIRIST